MFTPEYQIKFWLKLESLKPHQKQFFLFSDDEKSQACSQAKQLAKDMQLNVVKLCFQAYLRDDSGKVCHLLPPVLSTAIYDSSKSLTVNTHHNSKSLTVNTHRNSKSLTENTHGNSKSLTVNTHHNSKSLTVNLHHNS